MRMIILAAGQGTRLRPLTDDRPKCLVSLAGHTLLERQIETARKAGIKDIVAIGGYRAEQLTHFGIDVIVNSDFATTNMVRTLFCACDLFGEQFVMSYGDIVYSEQVLRQVITAHVPVAVAIDKSWRSYWEQRFEDPLSDAETLAIDSEGNILDIGQKPTHIDLIQGQYIGLVAFRGQGVEAVTAAYRKAETDTPLGRKPFDGPRTLDQLYMTDLLQGLIKHGQKLSAVPINGGWVEVDSVSDLKLAETLIAEGRLEGGKHG
jgi:choline kinase